MEMPKVTTSTSRWISLAAVVLAVAVGCAGESLPVVSPEPQGIPTLAPPSSNPAPTEPVDTFAELVERREQSLQTIAAIPTPTSQPTVDPAQLAAAHILGGSAPSSGDGLIPEPQEGIWWYRDSPGDWTESKTRERNPYTPLFEAASLEDRHPSFAYGGMQEKIARMLALEAEVLMPELDGYGLELVEPLTRNFGWEIAGDELPVARVWSSFTYQGPLDSVPRQYRMGGVMLFQVRDYLESSSGDLIYQYLDAGHFLGKGVLMEDAGRIEQEQNLRR